MNTKTILIVDDDPKIRKTLSDILRAKGYAPTTAATGKKALDMVKKGIPYVALIDLRLEDMSGLGLMKVIKERSPATECIVITGYASQESAIEAINLGAFSYVQKPYDMEQLLVTIQRAVEKREIEETLQENERYFRSLLHSMHEDILVIDSNYRITDANNMFLTTKGGKREDVIGRHCFEISHDHNEPCDKKGEECMLREVFETAEPRFCQHEHLNKDGSIVYVDLLVSPLKDGEGKVTHIIEAARNITELKQVEKELRESEEKYRTILASIEDGYYEVNLPGNFTFFNDSMCNIRGYPREELMKMNNRQYMDPETAKRVYKIFNEVYETGKPVKRVEWESLRKDGTKAYVESSISLMKDAKGRSIGFRGIVRDVSERKRLEAQLIQSQKMEAIGTLAGGVAHDFNNLLTTIMGNAHMALMEMGDDDPLREEIEGINEAGERASSLTRQLLAFSRKQVIQPKVLDLNKVSAGIEKMLSRLIGEHIELKMISYPGLCCVKMDPGQMEQVIMNLAINSKDAMPRGGKLTIETAKVDLGEAYFLDHAVEAQPGPYVMLAVSDTGIGMDEEIRSHIFEPFFTTKEKGRGTGLGLSTVYGIVKQSGGLIWSYSEPGQGTTFKIYFPSVQEDAKSGEKETIPIDEMKGSETILVVEDDAMLRKIVQKALQRYAFRMLQAQDAIEALRVSEEHHGAIHLMLTDVVMPGMRGEELAEHMQSLRPEIKVLYMSGYTDEAIVHHGVLTPGVNFIQKPFQLEVLARKVREVLDS